VAWANFGGGCKEGIAQLCNSNAGRCNASAIPNGGSGQAAGMYAARCAFAYFAEKMID
jgi:hypothetical protein